MRKKPVNLTISDAMRDRAERLMTSKGFSSFSAFVEQLIREEYERRTAPATMRDCPTNALPGGPAQPTSYKPKRR